MGLYRAKCGSYSQKRWTGVEPATLSLGSLQLSTRSISGQGTPLTRHPHLSVLGRSDYDGPLGDLFQCGPSPALASATCLPSPLVPMAYTQALAERSRRWLPGPS
jgi:hypothetical protein